MDGFLFNVFKTNFEHFKAMEGAFVKLQIYGKTTKYCNRN